MTTDVGDYVSLLHSHHITGQASWDVYMRLALPIYSYVQSFFMIRCISINILLELLMHQIFNNGAECPLANYPGLHVMQII
jgi:hypothetical protein